VTVITHGQIAYLPHPEKPTRLVLIRAFELGYVDVAVLPSTGLTAIIADSINQKTGITPSMREAMVAGSMFGWGSPIADPSRHANAKSCVDAVFAALLREVT
jgi:hypothetical protein